MSNAIEFKHISVHDTPEKSPGFLLWHISTSWRSFIEAVLKPLALTHPQFVVLATLGWLTKNGERVTQVVVGKIVGLDPNTTSQIIRGLEKKKLIKRVPSSDQRAKNPLLTTKGSQLLIKALPAVEKADSKFFKNLTAQEAGTMIQVFQKLTIRS